MLKVYIATSYVSVDGGEWREVGDWGYTMKDEECAKGKIILDNVSFRQCQEVLKAKYIESLYNGQTLFRHRPYIRVYYNWYNYDEYYHFDTISYKIVYKEWESVTLEYIMEHFPADKTIQYLKERGINTCPIINTK